MDESQKKIAELETRLKLAEQKSENDEELRKKDEEMRGKEEELEQAQADKAKAETDLTAAQNTIRILVFAAEQVYGAGKGASKYQYVEEELKSRGLEIDAAAIEAAVREMNLLDSWEAGFDYEPDDGIDDEYDDSEVAEHAEAE